MIRIAVASGKGGTGKTLVSTNLFAAAKKHNTDISIADCDAEEPNVCEFIDGNTTNKLTITQNIPVIDTQKCTFCGKCFEYCNYNAIVFLPDAKYITVVEDLCHDCGACSFACKFGAITDKIKPVGIITDKIIDNNNLMVEGRCNIGIHSVVPIIKNTIDRTTNGTAILDSPPGISCPFIATVDKADYIVLVTEPTPFGLNDLKLSVETLEQMNKPMGVIINRAGLGNNDVYNWLKQKNIALLMEIPFDREIARIYSEGQILSDIKPEYAKKFYELVQTITKQLNK